MDRITLTDDEMRQIMLRILHFYMNRRDYIIPNFVQQFHINTDFTDSDSQFLMNYYRELNRTGFRPNQNRLELIEQLLHQRTENMVINPRQSNRGRTRGRVNRVSPQRETRRSRGRANNRVSPQRARGRSRVRSRSHPPSPPGRSRSNSQSRRNRELVFG